MQGAPVTIRLLDPPLHEFLPAHDEILEQMTCPVWSGPGHCPELEHDLERVRELEEVNPMLGTRGVRLGVVHPEIYEMQVRAMTRAARTVRDRTGAAPALEIMIPLVAYERELELTRELVLRVAAEEGAEHGRDFRVGTMIELPRACLLAGEIAEHAEFFSFGTNDLTQTALGFSRDDIESQIMPSYVEARILQRSPFETIDETASASWCDIACAARSRVAARICMSASAASTVAIPTRSASSTPPGWTT